MVFGFLTLARVIKLPLGIRRRSRVRRRGGGSGLIRTLRIWFRLGRDGTRGLPKEIGCGAHGAINLVAPHDVTEGEKYARKQQHQHEQADDVPTFKHTLAYASPFSSRSHPYLCRPPKSLVH